VATVNRRLAAIRTFYHFLQTETGDAPPNPVLPRRHVIRQGRRLPRDAKDADIERLFAAITSSRDQAVFLLMLRCGLRVGEVRNLSLDDLCLGPLQRRGSGAIFLNRLSCCLTVSDIQDGLASYCREAGVRDPLPSGHSVVHSCSAKRCCLKHGEGNWIPLQYSDYSEKPSINSRLRFRFTLQKRR
jgi:hypothetical protein